MGRIIASLGLEPGADARRLDPGLKLHQGLVLLHPHPQHPRCPARGEMPGIGKGQIEGRRPHGPERRVDVADPALADLADEAEGEMKVS